MIVGIILILSILVLVLLFLLVKSKQVSGSRIGEVPDSVIKDLNRIIEQLRNIVK